MQHADLFSNEPELKYSADSDLVHRKQHGQFFTPYSVACFMAQWLSEIPADEPQVLDPCAGLGVFERALCSVDPKLASKARFSLWEKDENLARDLSGICERLDIEHSVINKDFVNEHGWSTTYDGVIANPPYYKHHFIRNKEEVRAIISARVSAPFSVQTNIYCWFLIKSLALLKPGGRLAFIVPTEFLNANYGREIKKYLLDTGSLRYIISFDNRHKTFDDAVTTACVVLAEKNVGSSSRICFYNAASKKRLDNLPTFLADTDCIEYEPCDLDIERKWRSCFPGGSKFKRASSSLVPLSTYGRFSRGIATGANAFFAIRPSTAEKHALPEECLVPCLSKAGHAPDKLFTREDFEALKQADKPVLLFDGQAISNNAVELYIRSGEQSGYQQRYLTRMRRPWYALEKRAPSRLWVGVFGRGGIRFVWNESDCITLTCFHVFQPGSSGKEFLPVLFLYFNSNTGQQFLELEKREYGDGLEKYEPNDINRALVPDFRLLGGGELDRLLELQKAFLHDASVLAEADAVFRRMI